MLPLLFTEWSKSSTVKYNKFVLKILSFNVNPQGTLAFCTANVYSFKA